jgi:hypothetical protein
MAFAAFAKFGEGKDEEAAVWANRSIDASPDFMTSHFILAAALVGLGRMAEAREAVRVGLALNPAFTIARYRASPSFECYAEAFAPAIAIGNVGIPTTA